MLDPEKGLLCDFCLAGGSEASAHTKCFRCGRAVCWQHSLKVRGKVRKLRVKGFSAAWLPQFEGQTLGDIKDFLTFVERRRVESDPQLAAQPAEPEEVWVDGYKGWACPECAEVIDKGLKDENGQPMVVVRD